MRRIGSLVLAFSLFALCGCFEQVTHVTVRGDGSGTIVITRLMKEWALKQFEKSMPGSKGGADKSEEEAREEASQYGKNVAFLKVEKIKTDDARGTRVTYAFKSVSDILLPTRESDPSSATRFKFSRDPGGKATLSILPVPLKPAVVTNKGAEQQLDLPYAVKRMFFAGLRVQTKVTVAGAIQETNSRDVDGSTVTLLEVDFDKLFALEDQILAADPKTLEEARAVLEKTKIWIRLSRAQYMSLDEVRTLLKTVKIDGMKLHLDEEVGITFIPE